MIRHRLNALAGMFAVVFECEPTSSASCGRIVLLYRARGIDRTEIACEFTPKIVGDFIAAHSTPIALREGVLYVRVLQPALHYELEQISKPEILLKLKQRFGGKTIHDVRFRVG